MRSVRLADVLLIVCTSFTTDESYNVEPVGQTVVVLMLVPVPSLRWSPKLLCRLWHQPALSTTGGCPAFTCGCRPQACRKKTTRHRLRGRFPDGRLARELFTQCLSCPLCRGGRNGPRPPRARAQCTDTAIAISCSNLSFLCRGTHICQRFSRFTRVLHKSQNTSHSPCVGTRKGELD
jgi:hypothetical protein